MLVKPESRMSWLVMMVVEFGASSGLRAVRADAEALDALQDFIRRLGPDERAGFVAVGIDEGADVRFERSYASVRTALYLLICERIANHRAEALAYPNRSSSLCSVQDSGRSIRFVGSSVVRSTG